MDPSKQPKRRRNVASNMQRDLTLLSSALRFGGELVDQVDEELATEIFKLVDAEGFDPKDAGEHDWHWIEASSPGARHQMAVKLRERLDKVAN